MICDFILDLIIIRQIFTYINNSSDFVQMFFSGLFSGAIVMFIFGWWLNKYQLKFDKKKAISLLHAELRNCYINLKANPKDGVLITLNYLYYWDHLDSKTKFNVFDEKEIKEYSDMYNYLDNIVKASSKIENMTYNPCFFSTSLTEEGKAETYKLIQVYQVLRDNNTNDFINCYENFFLLK